MDRIELSKSQKHILFLLKDNRYKPLKKDTADLVYLKSVNLCNGIENEFGGFITFDLTSYGRAYLQNYPKLNSLYVSKDRKIIINGLFITENKKFVIGTIISIASLILTIISLL